MNAATSKAQRHPGLDEARRGQHAVQARAVIEGIGSPQRRKEIALAAVFTCQQAFAICPVTDAASRTEDSFSVDEVSGAVWRLERRWLVRDPPAGS